MLREYQNHYPYNKYHAKDNRSLELCEDLGELLPHGSGIDYDWNIERKANGKFYASNAFHAMDENGFYCHIYDFTITYSFDGKRFQYERLNFLGQKEYTCCGWGMKDYIADTLSDIYF